MKGIGINIMEKKWWYTQDITNLIAFVLRQINLKENSNWTLVKCNEFSIIKLDTQSDGLEQLYEIKKFQIYFLIKKDKVEIFKKLNIDTETEFEEFCNFISTTTFPESKIPEGFNKRYYKLRESLINSDDMRIVNIDTVQRYRFDELDIVKKLIESYGLEQDVSEFLNEEEQKEEKEWYKSSSAEIIVFLLKQINLKENNNWTLVKCNEPSMVKVCNQNDESEQLYEIKKFPICLLIKNDKVKSFKRSNINTLTKFDQFSKSVGTTSFPKSRIPKWLNRSYQKLKESLINNGSICFINIDNNVFDNMDIINALTKEYELEQELEDFLIKLRTKKWSKPKIREKLF